MKRKQAEQPATESEGDDDTTCSSEPPIEPFGPERVYPSGGVRIRMAKYITKPAPSSSSPSVKKTAKTAKPGTSPPAKKRRVVLPSDSSSESSSTEELYTSGSEMDIDTSSSEERVIKKRKKPAAKKAKSAQPKPGGARALGLKALGKGAAVEEDVVPIVEPQRMFDHMAAKLKETYPAEVEAFLTAATKTPLRVATMCSGTESPLLALQMFGTALGTPFFEHVFSCEIEPFKQAYIERNFQPKLLFRDIRDIGKDFASTAYGGQSRVPGDVDVVIAGTVCKDFSTLNNHQKELGAEGQSGQTFRGLLRYVRRHAPSVVILENIRTAPWEAIGDEFEKLTLPSRPGVHYRAVPVGLDTKHYYLPQTRSRGYLCATLDNHEGLGKFQEILGFLRYPSGPTLSHFLLPPGNPILEGVKASFGEGKAKRGGKKNWQRCERRHAQQRLELQLGQQRPYSRWDEAGSVEPPLWAWRDWLRDQTGRVQDAVDILFLRGARKNEDIMYKAQVFNVQANVDRVSSSHYGICPCICPTAIPFISNRGGPLIGYEALRLQGIPVDSLSLVHETQRQQMDLAGNAMSCTVVGAVMMAAFLSVCRVRTERGVATPDATITTATTTLPKFKKVATTLPDLASAVQHASATTAVCQCEVGLQICKEYFECGDCGLTMCAACSETTCNPPHGSLIKHSRSVETPAPDLLLRHLPYNVRFETDPTKHDEPLRSLAALISRHSLHLNDVRRGAQWIAQYSHPSGAVSADLVISSHTYEWRVYAMNGRTLPKGEIPLRHMPILTVSEAGIWKFRETREIHLKITGSDMTESWQASLGISDEAGPFAERPRKVSVKVESAENYSTTELAALRKELAHEYLLTTSCSGPRGSLYAAVGGAKHYFFLDPHETTQIQDDTFVFSTTCLRLGRREKRIISCAAPKSYVPEKGVKKVVATAPHMAKGSGVLHFNSGVTVHLPAKPKVVASRCDVSLVVAKFVLDKGVFLGHTVGTMCKWGWVEARGDEVAPCTVCTPNRPALKWRGSTPLEDGETAAAYELALKQRPTALTTTEHSNQNGTREVRLVVNPATLFHTALSRLGNPSDASFRWRIGAPTMEAPLADHILKSNRHDEEYGAIEGFHGTLRREQLRSLSWMLQRDTTSTTWEDTEAAEATHAGLLLEAEVSVAAVHRGGVLADDVGYGKTVLSLALIVAAPEIPDVPPPENDQMDTNATLIIIPPHLREQWKSEAKKFAPSKRILLLKPGDKLSERGVQENDIIVVTNTWLVERLGVAKRMHERRFQELYEAAVGEASGSADDVPLEAVRWRRIIVDEFTYLKYDQRHVVAQLTALSKWLLSAIPDTSTFASIREMSTLIGPCLGSDVQDSTQSMTESERFYWLTREVSSAHKSRLHHKAALFLDVYVRQNVASIEEIPMTFSAVSHPISLPHHAVYKEMEMGLHQSDKDSRTESLILCATGVGIAVASETYSSTVSKRDSEVAALQSNLTDTLRDALSYRGRYRCASGSTTTHGALQDWEKGAQAEDPEVNSILSSIMQGTTAPTEVPYMSPARNTKTNLNELLNEASHSLRGLAQELVTAVRGRRYLVSAVTQRGVCAVCDKRMDKKTATVSTMCGHAAHSRHFEAELATTATCPVDGCSAPVKEACLLRNSDNTTPDSAPTKLLALATSIANLIEGGDEKVLVFSQYLAVLDSLGEALGKLDVEHCVLANSQRIQAVNSFEGSTNVMLVLMGEAASGLNLTHARNVIFVHPVYDRSTDRVHAMERQAVGRVHRYGQQRPVCVSTHHVQGSVDETLHRMSSFVTED